MEKTEKYFIIPLIIIVVILVLATVYAGAWGSSRCREAGGKWIHVEGSRVCVEGITEIDIYNND